MHFKVLAKGHWRQNNSPKTCIWFMYGMIKGNLENKNKRLYRHFNILKTDIDSFLLIVIIIITSVLFITTALNLLRTKSIMKLYKQRQSSARILAVIYR